MAEDEALVRVGEAVGGYEVLRHVGLQGMADCYEVRAPDGTERWLRIVAATHPKLVPALRALPVVGLRHPNLVGLVDVVQVGRLPGLVTERVAGPTLREWLDRGGEHDPEALLLLFRSMVEGVAAGHAAGLVHRDLRPENFVVEGEVIPQARVLDLGVASTIFELISLGRSVSTSGAIIGQPHYWAPERARHPRTADVRADLYSLGCLLYELFAGRGPFAGLNLYDCYHATLEERYTPLEQLAPDAPAAVRAVVERLLKADPDQRLQSCAELSDRLDVFTLAGDEPQPEPVAKPRAPTPRPAPVAFHPAPAAPTTGPWLVAAALVLFGLIVAGWWLLG